MASNIIGVSNNDAAQRNRPPARDVLRLYEEAKQLRSPYENDWRLNAAYCLPRHYGSWLSEGPTLTPGTQQVKRFAYDSTAAKALNKWAAILRRLATPDGHRWHKLDASVPQLRKSHRVRMYFDEVNAALFKLRYDPRAMFSQTADETYLGMGCYGTAPFRFKWRNTTPTDQRGGFGYKSLPLKNCFPLANADGWIDTFFYREYMTATQFKRNWPNWTPSKSISVELQKPVPSEMRLFEIVHAVIPRMMHEYDPQNALSPKRFPYCSYFIVVEDGEYVGTEGGYRSFPYIIPRTATEPGSIYGFSPAQQASAAIGGVNATKKTLLRQAQKAADPALLAADDGVLSGRVGQTPGYITYGAINAQGTPLVQPIAPGQFQPGKEILQDDRADIDDMFLVVLFQILVETPEMTATEVLERTAEKAALAAPTMSRLQSGMLGPEIERALDLIVEYRPQLLPPMPPELVEAAGEYEIVYTSPLAKSLTAEEDAGFARTLSQAVELVQVTQDPEPLDWFDFDVALPEIMDHQSVPARWTRDPDAVAARRKTRADAQKTQQVVDAAPAVAQIANATAKQAAPRA